MFRVAKKLGISRERMINLFKEIDLNNDKKIQKDEWLIFITGLEHRKNNMIPSEILGPTKKCQLRFYNMGVDELVSAFDI